MTKIKNFFWPAVESGEEAETAKKRILIAVCVLGAVGGTISGARDFGESFAVHPVQSLIALLMPLVFLTCPFLIASFNNIRVIALFYCAIMFLALLAVPLLAGGMFSHATMFMLPFAVLSTLFLGWKEGIGAGLLVFAAYLILHLNRETIDPTLTDLTPESLSLWLFVGLSISLFILVGGAAVFQREMEIATTSLRLARTQAEAASESKSQFLANMSHEIRTPMNGIIGMAEVLSESDLDQRQTAFVKTILASSDTLLAIINDILDISKIEAGHLRLHTQPFSVASVVGDMDALFAPRMQKNGLEFIVNTEGAMEEVLIGDDTKIRQILTNLIGNALKFTKQGHVRVDVRAVPAAADDIMVTFTVSDTGIGIEAEKLSEIFNEFMQADSATTRDFGGTGLGLSISRHLAMAMNGNIEVESTPGKGTTFIFELSLPIADVDQINSVQPKSDDEIVAKVDSTLCQDSDEPPREKIKVLVAEDNEINRMVLTSMIDTSRYTITFAVNGQEAVDAVIASDFDMVFMDISMPVMDGIAATAAIRNYERANEVEFIPIICLTAHALDGQSVKCREFGMDDYLSKPVRKHQIDAMLDKWSDPETLATQVA